MFFLKPGVACGDKWNRASQQFVGNTPQGVLVAFLFHTAQKLFWRHIGKAATIVIVFCIERILEGNKTKVSQEHISCITQENILRFEISVENIQLVCILQGLSYHVNDSERLLYGE